MKVAYPTFIREDEDAFLVYVPDFDIYTEGKDLVDAIEMAEDAIGMTGMVMEDEGKKLPEASDYATAYEKADKKVQDDSDRFDYTKSIITMVVVDVSEYRKKYGDMAVKRKCTFFKSRKYKKQ